MSEKPHVVERAYEIARSGKVGSIDELVERLKGERYENGRAHVSGSLRVELRKLIKLGSSST
jgi:hypothetical protein